MEEVRDIYVGDFKALLSSFTDAKSMLSDVINSINDKRACGNKRAKHGRRLVKPGRERHEQNAAISSAGEIVEKS